MTASVWAAIGSWGAIGVSLFTAAFVYGKLTQKVSDVVDGLSEVKRDVRALTSEQDMQGKDIVRIKTHLKLHN